MADREQIWHCAKQDLVLPLAGGRQDLFLWEHSRRVAENALRIAAMPEARPGPAIDLVALEAAALYHDAGWARQLRDGIVESCDVLAKSTSQPQRELSAEILGESLAKRLKPASLDTAVTAIRRLNDRPVKHPEARILADAESLDEVGNLALWGLMRRFCLEGKGVEETIRTWKRQREFRFWEARITGAFHSEAVKALAEQRLARLDEIFKELANLHAGEDLASMGAG